jgi:thiol-disulfide isomerase/thioredoxin
MLIAMMKCSARVSLALSCGLLLASCQDCSGSSPAQSKPRLVRGGLPVAPFVAQQLQKGGGGTTIVYVGASWCEPCQYFHRALEAGELDESLKGVHFLEYDYDASRAALDADGYGSRMLPLFALPGADGRAGARSIEGSIKGPAAVTNIVERLQALLAPPAGSR